MKSLKPEERVLTLSCFLAGVVVLEELEHALARGAPILAEFIGGSFTSDAYHLTDPRPDGLGVTRCIQLV